ncbi:MAG: hypothetical protein IJC20_03190 [Clostridia bacterium]|nr:hypothetical protein [Clostridia bacterium]
MGKKNKISDYITSMDKKYITLITVVLIYFGCFLVWCLLDTDKAEITGLNGPRLFYMLATPLFAIIYGIGSCKYTGKVIIPNLILLVTHLLFTVGTICIDFEDPTGLGGIIFGIPISILCAVITKIVLHFIKKE